MARNILPPNLFYIVLVLSKRCYIYNIYQTRILDTSMQCVKHIYCIQLFHRGVILKYFDVIEVNLLYLYQYPSNI